MSGEGIRDLMAGGEPKVYSVSELTGLIKNVIESEFGAIIVRGEISNYVHHSSGHRYFSIKDEGSTLRCVMFRSSGARLRFQPEDGMLVEAKGVLTVYERGGQYQLRVESMIPAGMGSLQLALEALKKRLAAEGLFDEAHKKPLPHYPRRIGVVTSPTGAAVRDIVRVLRRRFPAAEVVVCPVRVQGEGAADEIALAVEAMNAHKIADVLIVGRGGGSLEDLWAFNEERVARAIFASETPVVSAVGHEIDFTISDLVADVRAPTPSAAAEIVVRDAAEIAAALAKERTRLDAAVRKSIEDRRRDLQRIVSSYGFRRPLDTIREGSQRVDELRHSISLQWTAFMARNREAVRHADERLRSLDPHGILKRGFCICSKEDEDRIVTSSAQLRSGDGVSLTFWEGSASASVVRTTRPRAKRAARRSDSGG
jgi:exodeoxyribonuclease VII large subunit